MKHKPPTLAELRAALKLTKSDIEWTVNGYDYASPKLFDIAADCVRKQIAKRIKDKRRRTNAKTDKWRILKPSETIMAGDMVRHGNSEWGYTGAAGMKPANFPDNTYRRRVK